MLIGAGRRVAIINDRVLAVGDRIAGARVSAIAPDRVELDVGGHTQTLRLFGARATEPTRGDS